MNPEVVGLNRELQAEKKLQKILEWLLSVRQQIEHLEKRFGRKVWLTSDEVDQARANNKDLDIVKRKKLWDIHYRTYSLPGICTHLSNVDLYRIY